MGRHHKLRPERKLIKCASGNCDQLIWDYDKYWIKREYASGHSTKGGRLERNESLCLCGCGKTVTSFGKHIRRYIWGHTNKNKTIPEISARQMGENNPNWNEGQTEDKYRRIRCVGHPRASKRGYYVWEHVLVMEMWLSEQLGYKIYLSTNFHIHHINENKLDNRIENLRLMTHSEHIGVHNKLRVNKHVNEKIDNLVYYLKHC